MLITLLNYANLIYTWILQDLVSTIEDVYIASVDAGRSPRELLRLFDVGGLQGNGQVGDF